MSEVEELIKEIDKTPIDVMFGAGRQGYFKNRLVIIQSELEELQKKVDAYDKHAETYTSIIESYEQLQEQNKPVELTEGVIRFLKLCKENDISLSEAYEQAEQINKNEDFQTWSWFCQKDYEIHEELFAQAWLTNDYTVKQEQLYYVFDKLTGFYLVEKLTLAHDPYTTFKWTDDEQAREAYTEQQIKKHMGDNYMKFAVKVEEKQR